MGEKKLVTHRESEVLRTDRDDDFNMDPRGQGERKRVAKTGAPVTEQKMCRHFLERVFLLMKVVPQAMLVLWISVSCVFYCINVWTVMI